MPKWGVSQATGFWLGRGETAGAAGAAGAAESLTMRQGADMHPAMILRPATPADAVPLAGLGARAFTRKFGHLYDPADLTAFLEGAHTPEVVAAQLGDPRLRVRIAEDGEGRMIGFCKLSMKCGWPEHARGGNAIELKQLYTDPDATGRGIGAALIDWAHAAATDFGADEIQLSVWSGNTDAQRFYARHGYAKVADTEFWVGDHRDEEYLFARMI